MKTRPTRRAARSTTVHHPAGTRIGAYTPVGLTAVRTPPSGPPAQAWPGGGVRATPRSGEDADAPGTDQQSDDDEHDAPEDLGAKQGNDAGHHQHNRENPQQSSHGRSMPFRIDP